MHSALAVLEILSGKCNQIGLPWLVPWLTWNGFPSTSGVFQGGEPPLPLSLIWAPCSSLGRGCLREHGPWFPFSFDKSCHMNLNFQRWNAPTPSCWKSLTWEIVHIHWGSASVPGGLAHFSLSDDFVWLSYFKWFSPASSLLLNWKSFYLQINS